MILGRKEINFWPAYADILFVFFIMVLVVATYEYDFIDKSDSKDLLPKLNNLEDENKKLKAEIEKLKALIPKPSEKGASKNNLNCGLGDEFLLGIQNDLESKKIPATIKNCSLVLKEGLLFDLGKSNLKNFIQAKELISTIIEHANKLTKSDSKQTIDAIVIEGHADCSGGSNENFDLGYKRSMALYKLALQIIEEKQYDIETKNRLLAYLTPRSFGEYRPLYEASDCDCSTPNSYKVSKCEKNRRVEIFILGKVGDPERSWKFLHQNSL